MGWLSQLFGGGSQTRSTLPAKIDTQQLSQVAAASSSKKRWPRQAPGNFVLVVTSTMVGTLGQLMIACDLQSGEMPSKGHRFRVVRTGTTGTINGIETMADILGGLSGAANVVVVGQPDDLQRSATLSTSELAASDVQTGDRLVPA